MMPTRGFIAFWLLLFTTSRVSGQCKSCRHVWTDDPDFNKSLWEIGTYDSRCKDSPEQITDSCERDECHTMIFKITVDNTVGYSSRHIIMRGCGIRHEGENSCQLASDEDEETLQQIDQLTSTLRDHYTSVEAGVCSCTGAYCNTISFSNATMEMPRLAESSTGTFISKPSFQLITVAAFAAVIKMVVL